MARSRPRDWARRRIQRGLLLASACAALFACNALVGLDEYKKVECTNLDCGDAGFDATPPKDGSDRDVIDTVDAQGTAPVSWAAWRMPNYAVPDASLPNLMAYTPTTAPLTGLRDNITGLTWAHPMPPEAGSATYAQAEALCAGLAPKGSWRLPSRIELVTLLDLSQPNAKFHPDFFKVATALPAQSNHWSTSPVRSPSGVVTGDMWTVNFDVGGVDVRSKQAGTASVRCVAAK